MPFPGVHKTKKRPDGALLPSLPHLGRGQPQHGAQGTLAARRQPRERSPPGSHQPAGSSRSKWSLYCATGQQSIFTLAATPNVLQRHSSPPLKHRCLSFLQAATVGVGHRRQACLQARTLPWQGPGEAAQGARCAHTPKAATAAAFTLPGEGAAGSQQDTSEGAASRWKDFRGNAL